MKFAAFRLLAALGFGLISRPAFPAAVEYPVIFEGNVKMTARDGTVLTSDIYRPKADGRFPVLLERTPYDKYSNIDSGMKGAARGYVVILQDCRGRHLSGGEWYPFKHEGTDGYDAVEWAAALPYSDGRVALIGGSYVGATQMLAAVTAPPHLVALNPTITASDYYAHWAYQGGAFMQMLAQAWGSVLSLDVWQRRAAGTAIPSHWDYERPPSVYPVVETGTSQGLAQYYFDWLAHPVRDEYWNSGRSSAATGRLPFPPCTWPHGMIFSKMDRCATTPAFAPRRRRRRPVPASG